MHPVSCVVPEGKRLQILASAAILRARRRPPRRPGADPELRTLFTFKHILIVPFFASAICQSFLLSVWVAASRAMLWQRLC